MRIFQYEVNAARRVAGNPTKYKVWVRCAASRIILDFDGHTSFTSHDDLAAVLSADEGLVGLEEIH